MIRSGLTLVTSTYPATSKYLSEAAESIQALSEAFPDFLAWVIVVDGPGDVNVPALPAGTTLLRTGLHRGLPVSRNTALAHVQTEWLMPLDHDDVVYVEGLLAIWEQARQTSFDWIAGNVHVLEIGPSPHYSPTPRLFRVRELEENWTAPFAFYPNAVLMRTAAVLRAGGWPGLSSSEDLGLILRLNASSAGAFFPETLFQYRVWPEQMTQENGYSAVKAENFSLLEKMVNAQRTEANLAPIKAPNVRKSYAGQAPRPTYWSSSMTSPQVRDQQGKDG